MLSISGCRLTRYLNEGVFPQDRNEFIIPLCRFNDHHVLFHIRMTEESETTRNAMRCKHKADRHGACLCYAVPVQACRDTLLSDATIMS